MTVPQIDPYPAAPGPSDPGEVFDEKAFEFTQSLDPRRQQMNQVAQFVNDTVTQFAQEVDQAVDDATQTAVSARDAAVASANTATQAASDAESDRTAAQEARDAALAVVGFAGKWADLAGALNTPATVFHQGAYWRLLTDLADVTASEPANDNADWLFVYSNAELRRNLLDEATLYADFVNGDYRLYEGIGAGVVRNKAFGDLFNLTRSSNAAGSGTSVVESVSADMARFVYAPETSKRLGLLLEEQRTRLNTIAAAPTAPEGVTVGASAHTISFFGTGTVNLSGVATETLVGIGANDRVTLTFTPSAGTLTLTPSGMVTDLQLERGGAASSVIRGEGTQVTRAADSCIRTLGAEFNPRQLTMFFSIPEVRPNSEGAQSFLSLGEFGSASRSRANIDRLTGGGLRLVLQDSSGTNIIARNLQTFPLGQPLKVAAALSDSGYLVAVNGVIYSGPQVFTGNPDSLAVGQVTSTPGSLVTNAEYERVMLYPRALTEAELIALTQPDAEL